MMSVVVIIPTLFRESQRDTLMSAKMDPEQAKQKLDALLADGYRIKIMNDFVYENIVFTHYVLEKMSDDKNFN